MSSFVQLSGFTHLFVLRFFLFLLFFGHKGAFMIFLKSDLPPRSLVTLSLSYIDPLNFPSTALQLLFFFP